MRDYVRRILERRWRVEAVHDGQAALAAAERNPPDLILTDVMMPAMDGFELVRRLRRHDALASVPIVMLSARAGDEARVDGLDAGADDYLVKPFSARELTARIETQLKMGRQRRTAEEARATAEEATRAKDEFLAMLGHELRNPLAPILTTLQVMQLRGSTIFEKERALIDRQVRHVVRLVDDLLEVSRIARGKISLDRSIVDLGEVIGHAIELASPLLEQRMHHLTVDVDTGLTVDGDKMRLAQVFANLLTNAAKYTASGGSIAVSAKRSPSPSDDRVRVTVKDTGIGIRADMLPVVFDLFVQGRQGLDRSEGGLGLGLSIVKSLVTLHEGTVEAYSNGAGKGSEFVVSLPAAGTTSAAASRAITVEAGRQPGPPGRRVLVVDDNEDAAEALAEALVDLGHAVEVAHDGPQALAKLETFSPGRRVARHRAAADGRLRAGAPHPPRAAAVGDPAGVDHRLRPAQRPVARPGGGLRRPPGQAGRPAGDRARDRRRAKLAARPRYAGGREGRPLLWSILLAAMTPAPPAADAGAQAGDSSRSSGRRSGSPARARRCRSARPAAAACRARRRCPRAGPATRWCASGATAASVTRTWSRTCGGWGRARGRRSSGWSSSAICRSRAAARRPADTAATRPGWTRTSATRRRRACGRAICRGARASSCRRSPSST